MDDLKPYFDIMNILQHPAENNLSLHDAKLKTENGEIDVKVLAILDTSDFKFSPLIIFTNEKIFENLTFKTEL
nr:MAG TPA: hypothetical protein [Herelleviridae sp.]